MKTKQEGGANTKTFTIYRKIQWEQALFWQIILQRPGATSGARSTCGTQQTSQAPYKQCVNTAQRI